MGGIIFANPAKRNKLGNEPKKIRDEQMKFKSGITRRTKML
jgi:hypothetical protein